MGLIFCMQLALFLAVMIGVGFGTLCIYLALFGGN